MPMPSLLKYFAFVGTALLGLITLANFLLDPSTGATAVATPPKPAVVVQHDPRASKVERWRNEQAALRASSQTQTGENASLVTKSELAPPSPQQAGLTAPVPTAASQPVPPTEPAVVAQPVAAEPALQTADAAAAHDAEAARAEAARAKAEKAKAAKAARKARLARERARTDQLARDNNGAAGPGQFFSSSQQRYASSQQDQFYYGQRAAPREQAPQGYAYAPRPSFGPFGGFGRGW